MTAAPARESSAGKEEQEGESEAQEQFEERLLYSPATKATRCKFL